eukprot:3176622-Karenia_brevis.AAC.1
MPAPSPSQAAVPPEEQQEPRWQQSHQLMTWASLRLGQRIRQQGQQEQQRGPQGYLTSWNSL